MIKETASTLLDGNPYMVAPFQVMIALRPPCYEEAQISLSKKTICKEVLGLCEEIKVLGQPPADCIPESAMSK